MAYTTVVAGTVITASWGNNDVRNQVIVPFASTAARDAAITAPVAGQVAATTDTYSLWLRGASAWNQVGPLQAWTDFTPTVTQSGSVTKTVTYARWMRVGRLIVCSGSLAITGAGSAANTVTVSLPHTAASGANIDCGAGHIFDASAGVNYGGPTILDATSTFAFLATGTGGRLGNATFTAALAAGDAIGWTVSYEAAS